jgi:hypothetical protein
MIMQLEGVVEWSLVRFKRVFEGGLKLCRDDVEVFGGFQSLLNLEIVIAQCIWDSSEVGF